MTEIIFLNGVAEDVAAAATDAKARESSSSLFKQHEIRFCIEII